MSGKVSRRWITHPLPVTLLILSLLLLSVYWSPGYHSEMAEPNTTVAQIDSAMKGSHEIQVQLITPKADPTIVAIYVATANGTVYGGALTLPVPFYQKSRGTTVSIDIWKTEGGAGKMLPTGTWLKSSVQMVERPQQRWLRP